ncbi:MAG: hypothetical protein E7376_02435 [Clostridiales bacterium]|nr:hypothetical protein [Clostridiales bacterium]
MLSMLLMDFQEYLLSPARIAGLALIIIGISIVLIAKRLTRVITKKSIVDKNDRTYVICLTVGLVLILSGMVVCCF